MAVQDARQFLERLTQDTEFRANFQTFAPSTINDLADFALNKGFVFTAPELRTALGEFPDHPIINKMRDQLKIARISRPAQNAS